jgi:hypothetical protein
MDLALPGKRCGVALRRQAAVAETSAEEGVRAYAFVVSCCVRGDGCVLERGTGTDSDAIYCRADRSIECGWHCSGDSVMDEKVLGGLAGLIALFVSGAVFGRLVGETKAESPAVGDRIMCGLLAIPLIAFAARYALPGVTLGWALAIPAPLAVYIVLLACTDKDFSSDRVHAFVTGNFIALLIMLVGLCYAVIAIKVWQTAG